MGGRRAVLVVMACVLALGAAPDARAIPITITFEDLPDSLTYEGGGYIGSFYPGLTFSPNVYGLRWHDPSQSPFPSAGTAISPNPSCCLSIDFASPIGRFGIWYSSFDPLVARFYDGQGGLLGTVSVPRNDDLIGPRTADLLRFASPGIVRVEIGAAELFALDDLTYEPAAPIPEPATLVTVGLGLGALWSRRRRRPAA
jgi:hypothetical protein